MKPLTENEIDEIIDLAYNTSEKYILNYVNKKEFENIDITISLDTDEDSFNIDINIDLDSDVRLPEDLSQKAIDASLEEVDKYVEKRNANL